MSDDAFQAYDASPVQCHACTAVAEKARAWHEAGGLPDGIHWAVTDRREGHG